MYVNKYAEMHACVYKSNYIYIYIYVHMYTVYTHNYVWTLYDHVWPCMYINVWLCVSEIERIFISRHASGRGDVTVMTRWPARCIRPRHAYGPLNERVDPAMTGGLETEFLRNTCDFHGLERPKGSKTLLVNMIRGSQIYSQQTFTYGYVLIVLRWFADTRRSMRDPKKNAADVCHILVLGKLLAHQDKRNHRLW